VTLILAAVPLHIQIRQINLVKLNFVPSHSMYGGMFKAFSDQETK